MTSDRQRRQQQLYEDAQKLRESIDPSMLHRTVDPDTSRAAAKAAKEHIRHACLRMYGAHPDGLCDDDLGHLARQGGHESYRRRGSDLRGLGWTQLLAGDDGKVVRRRTQSQGGVARVSVLTDEGRAVLAQLGPDHG